MNWKLKIYIAAILKEYNTSAKEIHVLASTSKRENYSDQIQLSFREMV